MSEMVKFDDMAAVRLEDIDLDAVEDTPRGASSGEGFIQLNRTNGEYYCGEEQTHIPKGQKMLLNILSAQRGYMCFAEDQKQPHKHFVSRFSGKKMRDLEADLPDLKSDTGWKKAGSIRGVFLGGPLSGKEVVLEGCGAHFYNAFEDLFTVNPTNPVGIVQALARESKRPPKEREVYPIITLDARSYKHKKWGWQEAQVFKIESWASELDAATIIEEAIARGGDSVLIGDDDDLVDALPETEDVMDAEVVEEEASNDPEAPIVRQRRRRKA